MKTKTFIFILLLVIIGPSASAQGDEPASVRGRVTTLWGEPVEAVEVSFFELAGIGGTSPTEKLIRRVLTDKEGNYRADKLAPGEYRVAVVFPQYGHTEVWRFYLWRGANRVLDIGVPMGMLHGIEAAEVSGAVKDLNGGLVRDATVTLTNAYNAGESQQVRTDGQGRYSLREIQVGDYVLYVTRPGFGVSVTGLRLSNGEKKRADVRLVPAPGEHPGLNSPKKRL